MANSTERHLRAGGAAEGFIYHFEEGNGGGGSRKNGYGSARKDYGGALRLGRRTGLRTDGLQTQPYHAAYYRHKKNGESERRYARKILGQEPHISLLCAHRESPLLEALLISHPIRPRLRLDEQGGGDTDGIRGFRCFL